MSRWTFENVVWSSRRVRNAPTTSSSAGADLSRSRAHAGHQNEPAEHHSLPANVSDALMNSEANSLGPRGPEWRNLMVSPRTLRRGGRRLRHHPAVPASDERLGKV